MGSAARKTADGFRFAQPILLQLQFTVEDDGVFTMAWTATETYRPGVEEWHENVCAENTREQTIAGRGGAVPVANRPDF